jgi:hypothetical protein
MNAEHIADYYEQPIWFFAGSLEAAMISKCPLEPPFTCGFFLFDTSWNSNRLRGLILQLLERGCVSMAFFGQRSEEAHDLADRVFVGGGLFEERFAGPDDTLMTTGHKGVPLSDALFDLFCTAITSPGFTSSGYYDFSFGSPDEDSRLRVLLSDPVGTIRRALARDLN